MCFVCVGTGCLCVGEKEEKNVKIDLLNMYSIFNVKIIWKVVVYILRITIFDLYLLCMLITNLLSIDYIGGRFRRKMMNYYAKKYL